jgi:hypothetical protein
MRICFSGRTRLTVALHVHRAHMLFRACSNRAISFCSVITLFAYSASCTYNILCALCACQALLAYFVRLAHDENMGRLRAPMGLGVTYIKNVGVGMGRLALIGVAHSVYCHFTLYIPVSLL